MSGHRIRCMGPWPACKHAEGTCTASPDYQAAIAAKPSSPPSGGGGWPSREAVAKAIAGARGVTWDGKTVTFSHVPGSDDDGPTDEYFRQADTILALFPPAT